MTGSPETRTSASAPMPGSILLGIDTARGGRIAIWCLVLICAGLAAGGFVGHIHGYFEIEELPAFYGWFGFLIALALGIAAKIISAFLRRKEDYYGAGSPSLEEHPASDLGLEAPDA
ncbi:MAG: hypothetical protein KF765_11030 [Parvibaculaceae bacterium]|nr:hypothetical protein [Parvibaculaceae bacterium]